MPHGYGPRSLAPDLWARSLRLRSLRFTKVTWWVCFEVQAEGVGQCAGIKLFLQPQLVWLRLGVGLQT